MPKNKFVGDDEDVDALIVTRAEDVGHDDDHDDDHEDGDASEEQVHAMEELHAAEAAYDASDNSTWIALLKAHIRVGKAYEEDTSDVEAQLAKAMR